MAGKGIEGPHKVIVIGDPAVGKTSLINTYVEGKFHHDYIATLGVDFAMKTVDWEGGKKIGIQLWDIAGQEQFTCMTRVYYKAATACIIVFDITRRKTFEKVIHWKDDLDSKALLPNHKPVPCLLVANKCDLPGDKVPTEEIDKFAKEHSFIGWIATSAKEGTNINNSMTFLVKHIVAGVDTTQEAPSQADLLKLGDEPSSSGGCCKS